LVCRYRCTRIQEVLGLNLECIFYPDVILWFILVLQMR
jgi:hypothetical protein